MDEKPKTALDWIRWGQQQKRRDGAAPVAPPKPPARTEPPPEPQPPFAPEATEPSAPIRDDLMTSPLEQPAVDEPAAVPEPEPAEPEPEPPQASEPEPAPEILDVEPEIEIVATPPEPEPELHSEPTVVAPVDLTPPAPEPAPAPPAQDPPPPAEPRLPAAANSKVVIPEGAPYAFSVADFNFDETDDQPIPVLKIVSLAGVGAMRFGHEQVFLGQKMARADIASGRLVFLPGTSGDDAARDTFLFKVGDGEAWSRVAYTMTVETTTDDDD